MARRLDRTAHTTGAVIGATAIALAGVPLTDTAAPTLELLPDLAGHADEFAPLSAGSSGLGARGASAGMGLGAALPTPPGFSGATRAAPTSHTVVAGDTVWQLAQRYETTVTEIIKLNKLSSSALIRVGQVLELPGAAKATPSSAKKTSSQTPSRASQRHKVAAGDTLSSIAARHGTTTAKLARANSLSNPNLIRIGQVLTLPGSKQAAPSTTPSTPTPNTKAARHKVAAGDTLSSIAARHGTTTAKLARANSLSNPNLIRIGQVLTLPGSKQAAPSTTPSTPTPNTKSRSHVVKAGDTVWALASSYNTTVAAITASNRLPASGMIVIGQTLTISASDEPTPSSPSPASPSQNACQNLIPNTFLHYTYADDVVDAANQNKCTLDAMQVPSRAAIQQLVRDTAVNMGVDPGLAQAVAFQESGFNQRAVSPANAVGTMQVIPSSGEWAGQLLGQKINLLDPNNNIAAGIAILRQLQRTFPDNLDHAIGSYYQGAGSVSRYGLASDTRNYVNSIKSHMSNFN